MIFGAFVITAAIFLFLVVRFVSGKDAGDNRPTITRASLEHGILAGGVKPQATATIKEIRATNTLLPPSATPRPSNTPTVTPIPPTPTTEPTLPPPTPTPRFINDLNQMKFIIFPKNVRERTLEIYSTGQELGRNPNAFSRLGSSIVDTYHFLGRWDDGPFDLGPFKYLAPTIIHYGGSFSRFGIATHSGLNTWTVFDPIWVDNKECLPNEPMVDCEFRLHNPSILLIFMGTNDIGHSGTFEKNYRELLDYVIDNGVIPVLATKADRFEGRDNRNNKIVRRLAAEYQIPLWDFDNLAATIPGKGLGGDEVHMTLYDRYDYAMPEAYRRGYGLFNLSALLMLDAIRNEIVVAERSGEIPAQ